MKLNLKIFAPLVLIAAALVPSPNRLDSNGKTTVNFTKGVVIRSALESSEDRMVCEGCTQTEQLVVDFLYERGIKDPTAMAVILGNIKQESKFHPNICEGGARVPYKECLSGGYGLIQFTNASRYNGLGNFANRYGGNPSELMTQLRYIVNEKEWLKVEKHFQTEGLTKDQYMNHAFSWLGWGVYGNRGHYSNEYDGKLRVVS